MQLLSRLTRIHDCKHSRYRGFFLLQSAEVDRILALLAQFYDKANELDDAEYFDEFTRELVAPDDEERQLYAIPRVGRYLGRDRRSVDEMEGKKTSRAPRLGMRDDLQFGKYERQLPLPKVGQLLLERSLDNDVNEAKLDYYRSMLPRYGMRSVDEEKRAMGMLRMGKRADQMRMIRGMNMLRMGKRGNMSMLRMGRSAEESSAVADQEASKRAGMSMLRMGKRDSELTDNDSVGAADPRKAEKKNMSMLRMGKRSDSN